MNIYKLFRRIYVSPEFRALVWKHYPKLSDSQAYARMMSLLLFPSHVEQESGNVMMSQEIVAAVEDKTVGHGYSAIRFLEEYRQAVGHNFELIEYNHEEGRTRTAGNLNLVPEVEDAWRKELQHVPRIRVNFVTETPYNGDAQKQLHKEDYAEAMQVQSLEEATTLALAYLNNLSIKPFRSAVDAHAEQALAWAQANLEGRSFEIAATLLRHTLDQPKQLYRISRENRTMRLIPSNPGFARMHREMRQIFTQDWVTFDLKSAQLAICATLWGVDEVTSFLRDGKSIWKELFAYLGVSDKEPLKKALYGIVFGKRSAAVRDELDGAFGAGIGQRFLDHPLIAALLRARKIRMDEVKTAVGPQGQVGGAYDCFGRWIDVPMDPPYDGAPHLEPNYRSVLAQIAQAVEFKLLYPVFELAMQPEAEFQILLYQYDGFTVKFHRSARIWTRRIEDAVRKQAEELGVHTSLEKEPRWQG